tara:strand:- start:3444 stop:3806 length:363 start_codon:yes stop_codon:yes gene_type:complete
MGSFFSSLDVPLNVEDISECDKDDVLSTLKCMENFYDEVECTYPYSQKIKDEIKKQKLSSNVNMKVLINHIRKSFNDPIIKKLPLYPYQLLYKLLKEKYKKDKNEDNQRYLNKEKCKIKF